MRRSRGSPGRMAGMEREDVAAHQEVQVQSQVVGKVKGLGRL